MATAVDKPDPDQLDWGPSWEESEAAAARPVHERPEPTRGGLRDSGPLAAIEDWRDSRRMRRNLRRGSAVVVAGGATAGGLRELWYRLDDWRHDRKAYRYDRNARRAPRRGGLIAIVVVALALVAMGAALAIGSGSSAPAVHTTAAVNQAAPVPDNTVGTPPAVSVLASRKHEALAAARARKLAAMRRARAAALHRQRVAAFKARRAAQRAAHQHVAVAAPVAATPAPAPTAATPAPAPAPVTHPTYTPPAHQYTAPAPRKQSPPPSHSKKSFDIGG